MFTPYLPTKHILDYLYLDDLVLRVPLHEQNVEHIRPGKNDADRTARVDTEATESPCSASDIARSVWFQDDFR